MMGILGELLKISISAIAIVLLSVAIPTLIVIQYFHSNFGADFVALFAFLLIGLVGWAIYWWSPRHTTETHVIHHVEGGKEISSEMTLEQVRKMTED